MASQRRREGYLLIERRFTPPQPGADDECPTNGVIINPRSPVFESATFRCAHCVAIVVMNPKRTRARNYCAKCDALTCDSAVCVKECRPIQKLFDALLDQAAKENASHG